MKIKDEKWIEAFMMGYTQGEIDMADFLHDLPEKHGATILFQRDIYATETNQFLTEAVERAKKEAKKMLKHMKEIGLDS